MEQKIISENEKQTKEIAERFGCTLGKDDIVILTGELGARKNKIC